MPKTPLEKHFRFAFALFYIILAIVGIYFFATKVIGWILPFLFATLFAFLADPLVRFLQEKARIPRKLATVLSIFAVIFAVIFLATLGIRRLAEEISALTAYLPQFLDNLPYVMDQLTGKWHLFNNQMQNMDIEIDLTQVITTVVDNLSLILQKTTKVAGNLAVKVISRLPSVLIGTVICLLATYFISGQKKEIFSFIDRQISPSFKEKLKKIKEMLFDAIFKYIKAQMILMAITFAELSTAFLILKVPSAFLLAFGITLVDMFPILGTGTVLIPWALIQLLLGNYRFGIALLIVYGICLLVRQLLEPKIVSGQIGLNPLLTLLAMYIGLQVMGFIGMFIGVFILLVLVNLNKSGLIRLWK